MALCSGGTTCLGACGESSEDGVGGRGFRLCLREDSLFSRGTCPGDKLPSPLWAVPRREQKHAVGEAQPRVTGTLCVVRRPSSRRRNRSSGPREHQAWHPLHLYFNLFGSFYCVSTSILLLLFPFFIKRETLPWGLLPRTPAQLSPEGILRNGLCSLKLGFLLTAGPVRIGRASMPPVVRTPPPHA